MTHRITLQPSGHAFWAEENESILDAALRQGIRLPYGCRGGVCGACAVTVTAGHVHYPFGEPRGLAPYEEERGKALLCMAAALGPLELDVPQASAMTDIEVKKLPARVEKMRKLAPDVMELSLKLPASERLQFLAGQYLEIILKDGKRRAFSIANVPFNDQLLELHIRSVPNGVFTSYVFNGMQEKAILRIEAPLGDFYLRDATQPLILMGGGTGIAPLKAMLEQLMAQGFTQPVFVYWGARAKADLYLDAVIRSWVSRFPNLTYIPVLSAALPEDEWHGRTGWVHAAVAADFPDLSGYAVYMSGPPPMIEAAKPVFLAQGAIMDALYSDVFDYGLDTLAALKGESDGV